MSDALERRQYDEPSDADVIARVIAGDKQQFEHLVHRYQQSLYRHAVALVLDHDAAADMVQDAFVRAYLNLRDCRDVTRFRSWLFRTLRNRCLDYLKEVGGLRCNAFPYLDHYRVSDHLRHLERLLDWAASAGVPVVLVDMPVSADLQDGLHAAAFATYRAVLADLERRRGLRVIRAHRDAIGLTDIDFGDFIHLNIQGADRLSTWLRQQLDESPRTAAALSGDGAP